MPCGDRHLFAAADGEHGTELWVTDGTAEGTRMVIDMVAGPESSYAAPMGCLGDTAIFSAVRHGLARSIFAVEIERP